VYTHNRDVDIYNVGAAHLKKQAGCTAVERASFDSWLIPPALPTTTDTAATSAAGDDDSTSAKAVAASAAADKGGSSTSSSGDNSSNGNGSGCVKDAFRHFYPTARGCYTYWSARANGVSYYKYQFCKANCEAQLTRWLL
jgi:exonuclease III